MKPKAKAKTATVRKQIVPTTTAKTTTTTAPEPDDLDHHAVEVLMKWRDTASKRVDAARARMETLSNEYAQLNKQSVSDIKWIRRLHKTLSKKVFGHRPKKESLNPH